MTQLLLVSFVTGLALGIGVGLPIAFILWKMRK